MHSLAPYSIRVHDSSLAGPHAKKFHSLSNVRGIDLLKELKDLCTNHSSKYLSLKDDDSKKAIKFSNVTVDDREIYGFIEHGEYGVKGKVVDVESGTTVYDKKAKDADVNQLYFHFSIPKDRTNAICVFHNIHGKGVKSTFEALFNEHFKVRTGGLKLQIRPLSYQKVVQEWMENSYVKELRLQRYTPKGELSDAADTLKEHVTNVTLKPKKKGDSFGSFFDFYKSNGVNGSMRGAVEIMGNLCSSVKAVVEYDGRKRVFSLAANSNPVSSIEFGDDEVDMDDGAPTLISLSKFSSELLADLMKTT